MKKILLTLLIGCCSFIVNAQPPQRPLPNQFRDFVDHQQRIQMERPNIERKDGKVIITMSEEQYKRMQMMRQRPPMMMARFQQQPCCEKCQKHHKKPGRRVKNFRN